MDTLTKLQTITYMYRYVKFRSTIAEAVRTRKELEKEQFLIEKYSKWMSVDITRQQFEQSNFPFIYKTGFFYNAQYFFLCITIALLNNSGVLCLCQFIVHLHHNTFVPMFRLRQ
jgi:hypothetical protein